MVQERDWDGCVCFWAMCAVMCAVCAVAACAEPIAGAGTTGSSSGAQVDAGEDADIGGGGGTGNGDDVADEDTPLSDADLDVARDVDRDADDVSDTSSPEDVSNDDVPDPPRDTDPPRDVVDEPDVPVEECLQGEFAQTGSLWDLPPSFSGEIGVQSDQGRCFGRGDILHMTTDLNGDGRPDLVITSDCDDTTATGTTEWLVYLGGRTGFDFSVRVWPLPDLGQSELMLAEDQEVCAQTGDFLHILRDMDGDGRDDLVITSDCNPSTSLGRDFWRVHRNTSTGFTPTASVWSLPVGWASQEFVTARDQADCVAEPPGDLLHVTTDLTGDGRPDLVITDDCNATTATGFSQWIVYPNDGTSFVQPGIPFTVPASFSSNFSVVHDQDVCTDIQDTLHVTMDLTGDGFRDLVVTSDCNENTATGLSQWLVFAGDGSAFASSPQLWSLPSGYLSGQFASVHDQGECRERGDLLHTLKDMDGDGKEDLVISSDCQVETPTGLQRWMVHRNTGLRFSNTPTRWTLPPSTAAGEIATLEDQVACVGQGGLLHFTDGFDERAGSDLMITSDCNATTSIGLTQWLLFAGTCLD